MIDETGLLKLICENAQMGLEGITRVLEVSEDEGFRKSLLIQQAEYRKIYDEAAQLLATLGNAPGEAPLMAKAMLQVNAKFQTLTDRSPSHIAHMMIEGSTQGVMKITKRIHEYTGPNGDAIALAEKLLATEQANIEEMKSYL